MTSAPRPPTDLPAAGSAQAAWKGGPRRADDPASRWVHQDLLWRLLLTFSTATAFAAVSFGLFFLLVGGSALGWVIVGLALPLLAPWGLRRRALSPRLAANLYLSAGTFMMLWVTWVSGAARSTAFAAVLVLPIVAVMLVPQRDARAWLATVMAGSLGVLGGDSLGLAPPSLVPPEYLAETRLLTLLTGVSIAYAFSLIFRASYRRARDELDASRRSMTALLRGLEAAGDDLRRAAVALKVGDQRAQPVDDEEAPHDEAQRQDARGEAPPQGEEAAGAGLMSSMRREAHRAQELTDRAWRTVDGFERAYESIGAEILSLSPRLTEVQKRAAGVQALGARLDVIALHVGVQASQVGEDARPFQRLSDAARALAKRVEEDAEDIAATMEKIRRAGDRAAVLAREGTGLRSGARPRLEAMGQSFARVVELAEQASDVGETVVGAALQHLAAVETGLRDVAGPLRDDSEPGAPSNTRGVASRTSLDASPSREDRWARLPRLFAGIATAALAVAVLFGAVEDVVGAAVTGGIGLLSLAGAIVPAPASARPWLAALFLVLTAALLGVGSWLSGGLASPAFPGLVLLPVLGVFLFGRGVGLLGAATAVGLGGAFWAAEVTGTLPPVPFGSPARELLNVGLLTLFLTRLYQYSTWSRDQIQASLGLLGGDRDRAAEAAAALQAAGESLARATKDLRQGTLVEAMHAEAAAGEERSRETLTAFTEVVSRYESIEDAIHRAYEEAVELDEALRRIDDMAHAVDLLALQIALEAVRVGDQGAAFRLLADEMARLASATRVHAGEMMTRLRGARDAVRKTKALTTDGGEQARAAAEAVRELTGSFQDACALVEQAADASQTLAELTDMQLRQLRQGLAAPAVIASPEAD